MLGLVSGVEGKSVFQSPILEKKHMLTLKMYEAAKKAAQRHELANWLENHHQMQLIIRSTDRTKVRLLVGCEVPALMHLLTTWIAEYWKHLCIS